ncbi:EF-hand domain-containing protein [Anatilimnocola floriformis]|uniref:EF-hand domain-containing protein n=1 Tax=Anatilimnocola floriformis TaxID=2948575 RepID=UPI0020C2F91A|nr:EF-hand domain-containing protein [Anatilimnocola floriformis]
MKIAFGFVLVCGMLVSVAGAQNPQPNPQLPNLPANPQPGQVPNGQFGQPVNNGQAAAAQAAARAEIMRRFDRDGDGRLNAQEQIAATRAMQEHGIRTPGQPNMVGRGNGGTQTGPGSAAPPPPAPPAAPKLSKREELLLKRFDRDGDGKLSEEEKTAARAEFGQKGKAETKK